MSREESPGPVVALGPPSPGSSTARGSQVYPTPVHFVLPMGEPSQHVDEHTQGEQPGQPPSTGSFGFSRELCSDNTPLLPFCSKQHLKTQLSLTVTLQTPPRTLGGVDGQCCIPGLGIVEPVPPLLLPVPSPLPTVCHCCREQRSSRTLALLFPGSDRKQHFNSIIPVRFPSCHFS